MEKLRRRIPYTRYRRDEAVERVDGGVEKGMRGRGSPGITGMVGARAEDERKSRRMAEQSSAQSVRRVWISFKARAQITVDYFGVGTWSRREMRLTVLSLAPDATTR